jgi:hypothetical protein
MAYVSNTIRNISLLVVVWNVTFHLLQRSATRHSLGYLVMGISNMSLNYVAAPPIYLHDAEILHELGNLLFHKIQAHKIKVD